MNSELIWTISFYGKAGNDKPLRFTCETLEARNTLQDAMTDAGHRILGMGTSKACATF